MQTDNQEMWERLTEAVSHHGEADEDRWDPEPGDHVVGLIQQISEHEGRRGPYQLLHIETVDGRVVTVSVTKVIREELQIQDPAPGDGIGLTYHGDRKSQRGNTYKAYSVSIIPSDQQTGGDK